MSIVTGTVSSLQRDDDDRLGWIDSAASVAGGNSGSALVDRGGHLIGIVTRRYEGFARAIPVEFVLELLGEAALDVSFEPKVAAASGGDVRVTVKPRGPASSLVLGTATLVDKDGAETILGLASEGKLAGTLWAPAQVDVDQQRAVRIRATADSGFIFERIVGLSQSVRPKIPLRVTIHSVTLSRLKPNGWRWDVDGPDPFCKIYVNRLLVKQTSAARNQMRFLDATEFDCHVGDKIQIAVYDQDISKHDWAGEISFTAEPDLTIKAPTSGSLDACEVTLGPIPLRPPLGK